MVRTHYTIIITLPYNVYTCPAGRRCNRRRCVQSPTTQDFYFISSLRRRHLLLVFLLCSSVADAAAFVYSRPCGQAQVAWRWYTGSPVTGTVVFILLLLLLHI